MTRKFFVMAMLWLIPTIHYSQIVINDASSMPLSIKKMIEEYFIGNGIELLDISYDGPLISTGVFENAEKEIGLKSGIILSTGRIKTIKNGNQILNGGDKTGNDLADSNNFSNVNDKDIEKIAGDIAFNTIKYTIKFRPSEDSLFFKYVFASEEYPEYICREYNDVFGFFISGPGIEGIYENKAKNIALIPGTDIPVAINNIHPEYKLNQCLDAYENFYNNNNKSDKQPSYDGFLDVFQAKIKVIPCELYTIKIVIADVGDKRLDSAVFLEANSFSSSQIIPKLNTFTIKEGCDFAKLTFKLLDKKSSQTLIPLKVLSSSTASVLDIEALPSHVIIPAGEDSVDIYLKAILDSSDEKEEFLNLEYSTSTCKKDTLNLRIINNNIKKIEVQQVEGCKESKLSVKTNLHNSVLSDVFFANNEQKKIYDNQNWVVSEITISDFPAPNMTSEIFDRVCLNIQHNRIADLSIILASPDNHIFQLSNENGGINSVNYSNTCFDAFSSTSIKNGVAPFNGTFLPESNLKFIFENYFVPVNGTWKLMVKDNRIGVEGDLIDWKIMFKKDKIFEFKWTPTYHLSCSDCSDAVITSPKNLVYEVKVKDRLGCEIVDSINVVVTNDLATPQVNCTEVTKNSIKYAWNPVPGAEDYEVSKDNGMTWIANNNLLTYIIDNLLPNQSIDFLVRSVRKNKCKNNSASNFGSAKCTTLKCEFSGTVEIKSKKTQCKELSNGQIQVQVKGGNSPFSFSLGNLNNNTGDFKNLKIGKYDIIITDNFGCQTTKSIEIEAEKDIEPIFQVKDASCHKFDDGKVEIIGGKGGISPYSFSWDKDNLWTPKGAIDGLKSGDYILYIKDSLGCNASTKIKIKEPSKIVIGKIIEFIGCKESTFGQVRLEVEGGTFPYFFQWSNGSNQQNINNLKNGNFEVTVSDSKGCKMTDLLSIKLPEPLSAVTEIVPIKCAGANDGIIKIMASGGVKPYQYAINKNKYTFQNYFENLRADTYSVTIQDSKNCIISITDLKVVEPKPLVIELGWDTLLNYGDSLLLNPTFARPDNENLKFEWKSSNDPQSMSCVNCASPLVFPTSPVTYYMKATNGKNCTWEDNITVYPKYVPKIYVPTAFSPNYDNINDILIVHGDENIEIKKFEVYDRWGTLLSKRENLKVNDTGGVWNGIYKNSILPSGTYIWVIDLKYPTGRRSVLSGSVDIIQ